MSVRETVDGKQKFKRKQNSEKKQEEELWSYDDERAFRKWVRSHMNEYILEGSFEDTLYGE